jgi:hypothetical protein
MEKEIWKDIEGYEGLYKISSFGNVFSVKRNRVLSGKIHHSGYRYINLSKNNKLKNFVISRLVAIYFIPNPENKQQVDHIDRDPLNNHISNLRWATNGENGRNRLSQKGSSKYKGVSFSKKRKKWEVSIQLNNRRQYLGSFDYEKEAALAYNKKAKEIYGEFSLLNNIE